MLIVFGIAAVGGARLAVLERAVVDPALELLTAARLDQPQVVDPRRPRLSVGAGVRCRARVNVPADLARDRHTHRASLEAHLDTLHVERVEDQLHPPARERGVDLVVVGVNGHGRLPGRGPLLGPQERLTNEIL